VQAHAGDSRPGQALITRLPAAPRISKETHCSPRGEPPAGSAGRMWRRAPAARPLPRRGRCRPTPGLLRAALAAAACTCLAWAALTPLLPHASSRASGARLRVAVRPRGDLGASAPRAAAAAGNQSAAAGGDGGEDAWSEDWGAGNDEQGPGSAQWRAAQAGVEHVLRVMAAAGMAPPAFDAPAAARERAAFAPPGWAAAAAAAADPAAAREAAGAAFAARCGGAPAGADGQLAARRAAAAERLRVLRLDAAAAAHWAALDLPTLDQPRPAARRCAAARPPSTRLGPRRLVSRDHGAAGARRSMAGQQRAGAAAVKRQTVASGRQALSKCRASEPPEMREPGAVEGLRRPCSPGARGTPGVRARQAAAGGAAAGAAEPVRVRGGRARGAGGGRGGGRRSRGWAGRSSAGSGGAVRVRGAGGCTRQPAAFAGVVCCRSHVPPAWHSVCAAGRRALITGRGRRVHP
jgi:hypothetical protein